MPSSVLCAVCGVLQLPHHSCRRAAVPVYEPRLPLVHTQGAPRSLSAALTQRRGAPCMQHALPLAASASRASEPSCSAGHHRMQAHRLGSNDVFMRSAAGDPRVKGLVITRWSVTVRCLPLVPVKHASAEHTY